VVWCGVVWCGVVWCGVVLCGVVWCECDSAGDSIASPLARLSHHSWEFDGARPWFRASARLCTASPAPFLRARSYCDCWSRWMLVAAAVFMCCVLWVGDSS
jgi:hypothetical protein